MHYVIDPPVQPSLPVMGDTRRFPVRRIFCIGRNYAEHAREMGAAVDRDAPLFFCKPADAIVSDGADIPYPQATGDLHHEVEMVVALGAGGRDLTPQAAAACVWGHAVGLDLTRRDLQAAAKSRSHPWEVAKAFDRSAPVSALRPVDQGRPDPETLLSLSVNGTVRQQARLGQMLHTVPQIIATLSTLFELQPGDLIFTGTPAGVAALHPGDRFHAALQGIAELDGRIV